MFQGLVLAQTLQDLEATYGVERRLVEGGSELLNPFILTLICIVPVIAIVVAMVWWGINFYYDRKFASVMEVKKESFVFWVLLLFVGYLEAWIIVGTLTGSWFLGSLNIGMNVLYLVAFLVFALVYHSNVRFQSDFAPSLRAKSVMVIAIILPPVFVNLFIRAWSTDVDELYNRPEVVWTLRGVLGMLLVYCVVDLWLQYRQVKLKKKIWEGWSKKVSG
ncbi:MAG: hypothetical protein NTY19_49560 [Planctomycetota bacterium]|nr:hypothetical protein [Planctomycetota bacterium]